MAHKRGPSLRNRSGSDTFLKDYDLDEQHPPDSARAFDGENGNFHRETPSAKPWSPASAENGHTSMLKPHLSSLPPPMSQLSLPPGAETPMLSVTNQGKPVIYQQSSPTWANLPNKGQLAILTASRFVDFFQMAAMQTFMVHQLKSFDPGQADIVTSHQAGVLLGAFTAAQIITSILWGRAADYPQVGRKTVLLIGLIGTGIGCVGVGFSKSYGQAVFWRLLSGAINGTVGSARTMVAERTPKPWHPRAFLLLPAAFNFANVAGPILAGILVDPVVSLPTYFGPNSLFGGPEGVVWMKNYPFAAANLMSTILLFAEAALVYYGLEETLKGKKPISLSQLDPMAFIRTAYDQLAQLKSQGFRAFHETQRQGLLSGHEDGTVEMDRLTSSGEKETVYHVQRLPFHRIWTVNVLWTLLSIAIFDFHMGAFSNLWVLFLATPRQFIANNTGPAFGKEAEQHVVEAAAQAAVVPRSAFKFASGLAFPPPTIGYAMAIIGFSGVALQFLLYPWANARFGLMRCFRGSLFLFPAAYYLAPYIALLPSISPAPLPASGFLIWAGISAVLLVQVTARTFALPASIILLNNSCPHPSVLATIHGVGQACSATFRTVGPMLAGYWYGTWTERGIVGMAWWIVASVAALGCVASLKVKNGSGHEIFLPGEEVEMKEGETGGGSGDGR